MTLLAQKVVFRPSDRPDGQRIGLPFEPCALLCWWSPATDRVGRQPNYGGIGFVAAEAAVAHSWVSEARCEQTRASSSIDAAAVVVLDAVDATPALFAKVARFDGEGFVLDWRITREVPVVVHCLAIGGVGVAAAAGRAPAPRGPGPQSLRSMGLRPDLVMVAATPCVRPATPEPGLAVSIGAAAAAGGQAAAAFASSDGAEPGTVGGCQRIGAVIAVPRTDGSKDIAALARVASFDADGITLDWSVVGGVGSAAYLALGGGVYEVGYDVMPVRRRTRTTPLARTSPKAVAAFSWGLTGGDDTRHIARLSLGAASSASSVGSAAWGEKLAQGPPSHTLALSTGSLIQVPDTRVNASGFHADARLRAMRAGEIVLDWPVAEGGARQFVYVVFGERTRLWRRSVLRRTIRFVRRRMLRRNVFRFSAR